MFSPALRAAGNVSEQTCNRIASGINQVNASSRTMASSVNDLRQRLDAVNQVRFGTRITAEFNAATRQARDLERQIERLERRGQRGAGGGMGMLGRLTAGFGAYETVKQALGQAANAENQQIAFKVLTGSKKSGDELYGNVVKMADKTPYESQDLGRSAKTLLGYGVDKSAIMPTLNMLGDVAAATDAPAQSLQSLALAFGQVQAKGHLAGQEALQMINVGFNPLKEISTMTGMSMDKLAKLQEKGAISADMVAAAFKHATGPGGKFHDMMKEQSQTLGGRWSTFMDGVHHKLRDLGIFLTPLASMLMNFGTALMNGEGPALAIAAAIGILTLAISWNSIATWGLAAASSAAAFFTGAWTVASNILNASLWTNPVTWVVVGIIALIAAIGYVIYAFDGWGKTWKNLMEFLKFSWAAFKDFFNVTWLGAQDTFLSGIELIEKAWYHLKGLWDKDGASAGLASINNTQNARAAEIAKAKGLMVSDATAAISSMKWEIHSNGKGVGTIASDLKKSLGFGGAPVKTVDPTTTTSTDGGGANAFGSLDGAGKSKAKSINEGGQRSITITIAKVIEKIEMNVLDSKEGANDLINVIRGEVRKIFYEIEATGA